MTVLFATALCQTANAAEPDPKMIEALRPFDGFIGNWQGGGTSQTSSGWKESIECTWGFRESDGRVSINFFFKDSELFDVGLLTYHPPTSHYRFVGRTPKGDLLRFEGDVTGEQALTLDRAEEAKDELDRLELKAVRRGHKLIYTFKRQRGSRFFESNANVEHFREGPDLSEFDANPPCAVTGGLGRIPVEYAGKTYYVACVACEYEFFQRPDAYVGQ